MDIIVSSTILKRFNEKVDRSPGHGPYGDCYIWMASTVQGYGQIFVGRSLEGKALVQRAQRVSWFLETEEWPTLPVLHHCDNPLCVRFDHLFQGTRTENARDRDQKKKTG